MGRTTTKDTLTVIQAAAGTMPAPTAPSSGGSIEGFSSEGGPDGLVVVLTASGAEVTATVVEGWFYEWGVWSKIAQAGQGTVLFSSLVIPDGESVRFILAAPGGAQRLAISATLDQGAIAVSASPLFER